MRPVALAARDLTFAYAGAARPALADVSFDVEPGQTLLVVGPSGSGKSTLVLAMAGLVPRDLPGTFGGSLRVDDVETRAIDPAVLAARVGIVFQDPSSQIVMERVEDDVAFGMENRGWPLEAMRDRVPEALAAVGLSGFERRRSNRLSGGQQQRLALGGVLAVRPGALVLDEPTANLDPPGATALLERLAALRAELSTTIVLVEHRVDAAWPLADVVLALDATGRPIDVGPPGAVLARSAGTMRSAGIWLPGEPSGRPAGSSSPASQSSKPATRSATSPVLEARDVFFGYERDRPVVRGVDLAASPGERIALLGPNGSGKSTLGRLLVGLLRPTAGTTRLAGDPPWRLPAAELGRRAGYVFQDPEQQFLAGTVADEVRLGLRPAELDRVDELMEQLRLPLASFAGRSPYGLSGGEKRRLSLACILVRDPDVLVLDEPTFGQDRLGYESLLDILRERLRAGACLVAASHDERFVRDVADRVIELDDGWVVRDERVGAVA